MPIDLRRERLLPAKLLARYAPLSSRSGKCPHAGTITRWCLTGRLRKDGARIVLESIQTKAGVFSSRAALIRFLTALGEENDGPGESSGAKSGLISNTSRRAELESVQRELDAAGI